MESIDLELGELFDRHAVDEDEGDDIGANPDMGDGDEQQGDEVLSNLQKLAKGAAKKRVLRPQPKLDAQRLNSDRGLSCLPRLIKEVKFAGKGHEPEDLKLLMSKLEHWAHRLFPKLTFNDFVERLEKLGTKKQIQTCIKRIRLDMPLNGDPVDFVPPEIDAEAEFNAILQDERHQRPGFVFSDSDEDDQVGRRSSQNPDTRQAAITSNADAMSAPSSQSVTAGRQSLSSEQQQRIEQNRLLAMQKRAARLSLPSSSAVSSPLSSTSSAIAQVSFDRTQVLETVSNDTATEENSTLSCVVSKADVMLTAEEILDDVNGDENDD